MKNKKDRGSSLVALLFITVIGISVAGAATMLVLINSQSGLKIQQSSIAYAIAQSGAEEALLRLLRNPSYTGDSNVTIGSGTVDTQVSSANGTLIATSSGKVGNYIRKIQVKAHYDANYVLVIDSRKEIF